MIIRTFVMELPPGIQACFSVIFSGLSVLMAYFFTEDITYHPVKEPEDKDLDESSKATSFSSRKNTVDFIVERQS